MPSLPRAMKRRALGFVAAALLLPGREAAAHAILEASEPPLRGRVPAGAMRFRLRFNSRIDRTRSVLTLTRPDKSRTGVPILPDGPPEMIEAAATLTPGAHVLRWQVLAVDGHITRGDLPFTVTDA